ncbi:MAG: hypothetical protein HQM09_01535 [Candidatus Riflebacteria bacterium]|nr:hypothetical protein [Candidatus Riflebacteria bacterium]
MGIPNNQRNQTVTASASKRISEMVASGSLELPPSKMPVDSEIQPEERKLNISGSKTFAMKKADVKGDIGHFSTENYDCIPGFHLDQSLHIEIDGNINRNTKVNAVLDDKEDQDRRFTVFINGPIWDFTIGDFPLTLKDTEFVLNNKEVRGILAQGAINKHWKTVLLFSQSKGVARREQFRGAGQQQEFRLLGKPVVQNSERASIDGKALVRGTDYLIDYEEGIMKLQPHLLPVEATSWIVIEYEVTDQKLAFKRNLYGGRIVYERNEANRVGMTILRELDATVPKGGETATATARPMDHVIAGFDGQWRLNKTFSLSGEYSRSKYDPNALSEETPADRAFTDSASRLEIKAKNERLDGELGIRQVGKDFKLIGREGGVTELGERGLVSDIRKETGRFNYAIRPTVSLFGGLEQSKTNMSHDPTLSRIDFAARNGGVTWKYKHGSQVEGRLEQQIDRENKDTPLTNRDKQFGAFVWDHEFGKIAAQTKLERTTYLDSVNLASGSRVLQLVTSINSAEKKRFAWSTGYSRLNLEDDYTPGKLRSTINNYTVDMNFDPNRVFNARGIFQWRNEHDFLVKTDQNDEVADSRFRYQPTSDFTTQLKYKVENTTKIVRDPSIDPAKYVRPPSLPVTPQDAVEVVGRFENPVRKETTNFTTNYRLGERVETYFDWKCRDLIDRSTRDLLSHNDRRSYEFKYVPVKQIRITMDYENGVARSLNFASQTASISAIVTSVATPTAIAVASFTPKTELLDTLKRIEIRNEFYEGYIVTGRWEDHDENDVYLSDNSKHTVSRIAEFNRVFSRAATLELGVQRNVIDQKMPSKEWQENAAFVLTPSAKNQRYKLFIMHKSIESVKPETHIEGGLNFSQFIGTDSIIDGEVKKVKSTGGLTGAGYEATIANAKMVITF